ncbi:MAG: hypothetical protein Q8K00_01195 [Syntrophales bacterium]|nr:hypothetical protein [Syntrophales bacterium]
MADQEGVRPVGCGYGLLGLCCVSCLRGPCRRSPFDDAGSGVFCGEDSDWIVAHNIMQRVSLESLQMMAAFRNDLEQASNPGSRIEASRLEEMRLFLSPFTRGPSPLLEPIYPERAFPTLHALGFPQGSWIATLLDAMTERPPARRDPEAILADALRLSAMALAVEGLTQELAGLPPEESDVALPDSPSPLLLLISDEGGLQDDGRDALMKKIDTACGKEARIYRLPHVTLLPSFARSVFTKWGIPISMTTSIAVVFSSSMIRGLGALALGFSSVSFPGYPIQGSPLVENYLTQDLKRQFGHAYLTVPPREDPCETILRSLRS